MLPEDPTIPPDEPGATPDEPALQREELAAPPEVSAQTVTGRLPARGTSVPRPELLDPQEPVYRECGGYRLRLEAADLARLRELPGSRGKSDEELGEAFFDGQAARLAASVADDVPTPAELRVVVDPFSRQAFVAVDNHIRGILSF